MMTGVARYLIPYQIPDLIPYQITVPRRETWCPTTVSRECTCAGVAGCACSGISGARVNDGGVGQNVCTYVCIFLMLLLCTLVALLLVLLALLPLSALLLAVQRVHVYSWRRGVALPAIYSHARPSTSWERSLCGKAAAGKQGGRTAAEKGTTRKANDNNSGVGSLNVQHLQWGGV